jgi:hypothetical protein
MFLVASTFSALAADVEILGGQVILSGEILDGDAQEFQISVDGLPAGTIVRLQSPGGLTAEGIAIGRTIREMQFVTYAPYGPCASACGLIWLGGVERWVNSNAKVGFHQAHTEDAGKLHTSGVGNALVGAYMNELGYSDDAIVFATVMEPEGMAWLTQNLAARVGLGFHEGTPLPRADALVQNEAIAPGTVDELWREAEELFNDGRYYEGVVLYRELADQGHAQAQVRMGAAHYAGIGAPQDYTQAARWFGLSAGQGDPVGQFAFGSLFLVGNGVVKDRDLAFQWITKSANQGYARAQTKLGDENSEKGDYDNAQIWYRKAAAQGDAKAQENLSWMYANGWGVAQDPVMRLMWYDIAKSHGTDGYNTPQNREDITKRMLASQVAEAERRRRICVSSGYQNCEFAPFVIVIPKNIVLANKEPYAKEVIAKGFSFVRSHFQRAGESALSAAQFQVNQISEFELETDGRWGANTEEAFLRVFIYYANSRPRFTSIITFSSRDVPEFIDWLTETAKNNSI